MVYKNCFQQDAITEDSLQETVNTGLYMSFSGDLS